MSSIRLAAGLLLGALAGAAEAQLADEKVLTLEGAKKVVAAAAAYARTHGAPGGAVAVVDRGGNLIALERLDGTFAAAAGVAIGKARTAATFQRSTKVFEDIVNHGRTTMVALSDFTPLQGGVPIVVGRQVVGAVGVSGAASAQQDEEIAIAGAGAITGESSPVIFDTPVHHFDAERVTAAFARGDPLIETGVYKVHASRRTEPGLVEVHDDETDVFFVLEGAATLVIGGKPIGGRVTGSGQFRAPSVEGGNELQIAKGDVLVIPAGVPHWFKAVRAPVLYFTVKPIAPAGGVQ